MAILDAQLLTVEVSDGEEIPAFIDVGQIVSLRGSEGEAVEIPTTHLGSTWNEFVLGLADEGGFNLTLRFDPTNLGQAELSLIKAARETRAFVITLITGHTYEFDAYVKSVSESSGVNGLIERTVNMMIDGDVTITPPA